MRSNFLKQKTAMVGDIATEANKENVSSSANKETKEEAPTSEYEKEGYVEPLKEKKELTEEEKEELAKKAEQEAI